MTAAGTPSRPAAPPWSSCAPPGSRTTTRPARRRDGPGACARTSSTWPGRGRPGDAVAAAPAPSRAPDRPLALSVQGLAKRFPTRSGVLQRVTGGVDAVDGVSLDIPAGTTLGLVGESGSGKSTLARLVVRIVEPTAGSVIVDGTDVTVLSGSELGRSRRQMQMVFQDPYSSLDPSHTIGDTVSEPLVLHTDLKAGARRARTRELLALVGLGDVPLDRYPHQFSGGQRQRIAIARALAVNPSLLVCDEAVERARRVHPGPGAQPARRPAAGAGHGLPVHLPRPLGGPPHRRPHRRHVPGPDRGGGAGRPGPRPARPPLHGRPAVGHPGPRPGGGPERASGWCSGARWRPRPAGVWVAASPPGAPSPWTSAGGWTRLPFAAEGGTTVRCHLHTEGPVLGGRTVLSLTPAGTGGP